MSYKIFKRCPALLPALVDLYNACWQSQAVPLAWKQGVIKLIPKQSAADNPAEPSNFRPIALTSCVGKVFTSILKDRWFHLTLTPRRHLSRTSLGVRSSTTSSWGLSLRHLGDTSPFQCAVLILPMPTAASTMGSSTSLFDTSMQPHGLGIQSATCIPI